MALALFDLDNTLLNGDSDHGWGMYLAEIGAVDANHHKHMQDKYYQDYVRGELDIIEFLNFHLAVLAQYPKNTLYEWRDQFLAKIIQPMISSGKGELVEKHRALGHHLIIITATSDFVAQPIADCFNVDTLIATTAEKVDGEYTGSVTDTPCFQDGKIKRLEYWTQANNENLDGSWFYSDSYNDLPLLQIVDNPVAVTPDQRLRAHATQSNWPIID